MRSRGVVAADTCPAELLLKAASKNEGADDEVRPRLEEIGLAKPEDAAPVSVRDLGVADVDVVAHAEQNPLGLCKRFFDAEKSRENSAVGQVKFNDL